MKVYPWIGDPKTEALWYFLWHWPNKKSWDNGKVSEKAADQLFSLENGDYIDHVHTCIIKIQSIKRL